MPAAQAQDQQKAANAVHDAAVAGARAKVPRKAVPVDRREGRVLRLAQPHRDTGNFAANICCCIPTV